jgi:peptidoglycan-associated lipoprotein
VEDTSGCPINPVYFAFDADLLETAARNEIERNVRCMRERNIESVHLTGHCDPRGTEEYNLALGDRRAQGVRQFVISLGIAADKVTASSMGEEMAQGMDEAAWSRDRRVDFVIR